MKVVHEFIEHPSYVNLSSNVFIVWVDDVLL